MSRIQFFVRAIGRGSVIQVYYCPFTVLEQTLHCTRLEDLRGSQHCHEMTFISSDSRSNFRNTRRPERPIRYLFRREPASRLNSLSSLSLAAPAYRGSNPWGAAKCCLQRHVYQPSTLTRARSLDGGL